jgi:hypothetical protein
MAIARRRRAELAKVLRSLMNDTTQDAQVRLRAASKLQRLYESETPAPSPAPKPMTADDARAAIAAVTKGNANAQA